MHRRARTTGQVGARCRTIQLFARRVLRLAYVRSADRPGELAAFIAATDVFQKALQNPRRRLEVHRWMPPSMEMAVPRWPVPPLPDLRALGVWLDLDPGQLAWFADVRSMERRGADE